MEGSREDNVVPSSTAVPHTKLKPSFALPGLIIILYFQDVKKRINRFRLANCEKSEDV